MIELDSNEILCILVAQGAAKLPMVKFEALKKRMENVAKDKINVSRKKRIDYNFF